MEQMQELEKLTPAEKMKLAWQLYDEAIEKTEMPKAGTEIELTAEEVAETPNENAAHPVENPGGIWLGTDEKEGIVAFAADGGNIRFKDAKDVKKFCDNAHMLLKIIHAV